jgi:site-specific recombinase XerD
VLKEAGIKDAGLHTLRHTFGSHCVMAGIDLPTISKFMGHSDIKTTMIYVHLSSEHMQSSILKLGYTKRHEVPNPGGAGLATPASPA